MPVFGWSFKGECAANLMIVAKEKLAYIATTWYFKPCKKFDEPCRYVPCFVLSSFAWIGGGCRFDIGADKALWAVGTWFAAAACGK